MKRVQFKDEDSSISSPCWICMKISKNVISDDKFEDKVVTSFFTFCKGFLHINLNKFGISPRPRTLNLEERLSSWPGANLFCEECQLSVNNLVKIYTELKELEMKLLLKVIRLEEVIVNSSTRLSWSSDENEGNLQRFRKEFSMKCQVKSRKLLQPFVILNLVKDADVTTFTSNAGSVRPPSKQELDIMISLFIIVFFRTNWDLNKVASGRCLFRGGGHEQNDDHLKHLASKKMRSTGDGKMQKLNRNKINSGISKSGVEDTCEKRKLRAKPRRVLAKEIGHSSRDTRRQEIKEDVSINAIAPKVENSHEHRNPADPNNGDSMSATMGFDSDYDNDHIGDQDWSPPPSEPGPDLGVEKESGFSVAHDNDTYHEPPKKRRGRPKGFKMSRISRRRSFKTAKPRKVNSEKVNQEVAKQWKCSFCQLTFPTQRKLHLHKRDIEHFSYFRGGPVFIPCNLCPDRFPNPLSLYDHIFRSHEGGPDNINFTCDLCHLNQADASDLIQHIKETHEDPENKLNFCPYCHESFTSSQLLDWHHRFDHWKDPPLFCDDDNCQVSFPSVSLLIAHVRNDPSHQNQTKEIFYCDVCSRPYFSKCHCFLHKLIHTRPDPDGYISCTEKGCSYRHYLPTPFMNHYVKKHPKESEHDGITVVSKCEKCPHYFSCLKQEMNFHLQFHATKDTYNCKLCRKGRFTFDEYKAHATSVEHLALAKRVKDQNSAEDDDDMKTEGGERYLKCQFCEEAFPEYRQRTRHIKKEHPDAVPPFAAKRPGGPYICEICGKSYQSRSCYVKHKYTHGDAQFSCPHCPRMFRREDYVRVHINRIHTKKDIYVCETCGKSSPTEYENTFHQKEHQLLHSCHLCPKRFSRRNTLKRHLWTHTGTKLQCGWCPKRHTALGNMKMHVKQNHPEEYQFYYGNTKQRTTLRFKIVKATDVDTGGEGEGDGGNLEADMWMGSEGDDLKHLQL